MNSNNPFVILLQNLFTVIIFLPRLLYVRHVTSCFIYLLLNDLNRICILCLISGTTTIRWIKIFFSKKILEFDPKILVNIMSAIGAPPSFKTSVIIIIIIIIMTFIPRILASASNAPKQSHCQTGKSLTVYKKLQKSQWNVSYSRQTVPDCRAAYSKTSVTVTCPCPRDVQ